MAAHRTDQKQLPLLVVGEGLPLPVRPSATVKTHAERLFEYPDIGALDPGGARGALVKPVAQANVEFDDDATAAVIRETRGYPVFPSGTEIAGLELDGGLSHHQGGRCKIERSRDRAPGPALLQVVVCTAVGAAESLSGRDGAMRFGSPSKGRHCPRLGQVVAADGSDPGGADRQRHDLRPATRVCGVHRIPHRCLHETDPRMGCATAIALIN